MNQHQFEILSDLYQEEIDAANREYNDTEGDLDRAVISAILKYREIQAQQGDF